MTNLQVTPLSRASRWSCSSRASWISPSLTVESGFRGGWLAASEVVTDVVIVNEGEDWRSRLQLREEVEAVMAAVDLIVCQAELVERGRRRRLDVGVDRIADLDHQIEI